MSRPPGSLHFIPVSRTRVSCLIRTTSKRWRSWRKGWDCQSCALALESDPAKAGLKTLARDAPHQSTAFESPLLERVIPRARSGLNHVEKLAEGVGFEPTVSLTPRSIS